jgi:DsbC/DsbD-like thiol-disulfide interchange protein
MNGSIRSIRWLALSALACATLVFAANTQGEQGGDKMPSKVKLKATTSKIDKNGQQVVTIKMEVDKDWHAYANPVQNELLEAAQTTVEVKSNKKLDAVVAYPQGKKHVDGKESYYIYEGQLEIMATVKRPPGDTGPLEVKVSYMTCNDKICLPPESVVLNVK